MSNAEHERGVTTNEASTAVGQASTPIHVHRHPQQLSEGPRAGGGGEQWAMKRRSTVDRHDIDGVATPAATTGRCSMRHPALEVGAVEGLSVATRRNTVTSTTSTSRPLGTAADSSPTGRRKKNDLASADPGCPMRHPRPIAGDPIMKSGRSTTL
jgi:hypothetical protein